MTDAAALSAKLATSTDAQACVVENWAVYALGRRLDDELDACSVLDLQATFAESDGDLLELHGRDHAVRRVPLPHDRHR